MFEFLPEKLQNALLKLNYNDLYGIRIRAERPVMIEYALKKAYLSQDGITLDRSKGIFISKNDLKNLIFDMCERSVYAYADKISRGFISVLGGVRVGIGGECVLDDGKIINVKEISSVNIRIPHAVKDCADEVFKLFNKGLVSVLIVSKPGVGKTTIIRDLSEKISQNMFFNVLIVDERGEIAPLLNRHDNIDVISFSQKKYAFENGVRALAPDIIVTDEIIGEGDLLSLRYAVESGVSAVATMHGNIENFIKRRDLFDLQDIFDYFVFLSCKDRKGKVEQILDKNLNRLIL